MSSEDRRTVERFRALDQPSGAVSKLWALLSVDEEGDVMRAAFMTGQLLICAAMCRGRSSRRR
jgi:hypothetical protein